MHECVVVSSKYSLALLLADIVTVVLNHTTVDFKSNYLGEQHVNLGKNAIVIMLNAYNFKVKS